MEWFIEVVRNKYADFNGRARRKEYWMFHLFTILIAICYVAVMFTVILLMGDSRQNLIIVLLFLPYIVYCLAMIVPSLAVMVRRLHDTGRSGWWYFIGFVPLAGPIILLVFTCLDSDPGPNFYGPSPKYPTGYMQIPPPYQGR